MSLYIGKAYVSALLSNRELVQALGGGNNPDDARIFTVARPSEDEKQDHIPYIIIQPQGLAAGSTKDAYEEGDSDTVSILIVASDYDELIDLSQLVRDTIATMLVDVHDGFQIDDYNLTVTKTLMDVDKPCYFHELIYQTNTQNT